MKKYEYLEYYNRNDGTYMMPYYVINYLLDDIEDLIKENKKLVCENRELEEKIKKTRIFIENHICICGESPEGDFREVLLVNDEIYELLNRIASGGDIPNEIIFHSERYHYNKEEQDYYEPSEEYKLLEMISINDLNDKVEIVDKPKKIEKLDMTKLGFDVKTMLGKINEIIDKLNSMEE